MQYNFCKSTKILQFTVLKNTVPTKRIKGKRWYLKKSTASVCEIRDAEGSAAAIGREMHREQERERLRGGVATEAWLRERRFGVKEARKGGLRRLLVAARAKRIGYIN